jgi:hypothetical protein
VIVVAAAAEVVVGRLLGGGGDGDPEGKAGDEEAVGGDMPKADGTGASPSWSDLRHYPSRFQCCHHLQMVRSKESHCRKRQSTW